ncbi:MAG: maleylacetoacetate isomerase [Polyangiaceae bacterium]|jgi:maleylpyruvate isomerase
MTELVLYTYWRSSSAYRVRLALGAKGLAYRSVAVNLLTGAQLSAEHVARSPMGYVPCLEVNGEAFVESVAIIELLDELYPEPNLLPRDPVGRARVRALVEVVNSGTQPLQNLSVLQKLSPDHAVRKEWIKHFIAKGLGAFEAMMALNEKRAGGGGMKGRFSYGDTLSMADCYLLPQVYNARRYEVDLAPFPRVAAAANAIAATDAGRAAAPEAQPDATPDAR